MNQDNISSAALELAVRDAVDRALHQTNVSAQNQFPSLAATERPIVLTLNGRQVGRAMRDDTAREQATLNHRLSMGVGR